MLAECLSQFPLAGVYLPLHQSRMSASGLKRTSSPVARAPGVRETPVRAVPIKAVAASDVRDFPAATLSAGEQANPKQGFVSRSGGAFKFRALAPPPIRTGASRLTSPGHLHQELRAATHARGSASVSDFDQQMQRQRHAQTAAGASQGSALEREVRPHSTLGFGGTAEWAVSSGRRPGEGWMDDGSQFEAILPSASGRRGSPKTGQLLRLQKLAGAGTHAPRKRPPGALSSERINAEAARVFGEDADHAVRTDLAGVSKFVEARALDLRLQDAIAKGKVILERPPLSEAKAQYYAYFIPELFAVFDLAVDAVGPFRKVLQDVRDHLHLLTFSSDKDFKQASDPIRAPAVPFVQLVGDLKREAERQLAAQSTQAVLLRKAETDKEASFLDTQQLNLRIHEMKRQLRDHDNEKASIQADLDMLRKDHEVLKTKYNELQKGFLLGQLQDEMKDILMNEIEDEKVKEGRAGGKGRDVNEAIEEQSAMQKLIQQLKDSRQAMLNAQDDMLFWQGKYRGLEDRLHNLQESFNDAANALELTKDKMTAMVPSAVHVALQDRYKMALNEMSNLREKLQADNRFRKPPSKAKEYAHDDWRLYGKEEDGNFDGDGGAQDADDDGGAAEADLDVEESEQVPKDFVLSVAEQRDKLNDAYRSYRKTHSTSVISWMQLKTMTLAEFARLEKDCFAKHSIWALALLRPEKK